MILHREGDLAHDFIDDVRGLRTQDLVRAGFGDQIDVFAVGVQLHPVSDGLLHTSVDASDGGSEFVLGHVGLG